MSPRRSSRARTTQPPNTHSSSSSSVVSNRQDRTARANQDQANQMKSATPQSESDEAGRSQPPELETRQTRRQKREQGTIEGTNDKLTEVEVEEEGDDEEEEEVTRCICGQPEYPGPPIPLSSMDSGRGQHTKEHSRAGSQTAVDTLPEDAGSLFIQCDECHVWQHGGCVGIMDEATSPDNYYCEECRSDLHKIMVGVRGQRYSRYLPLYETSEIKTPRRSSGPNAKETFSRSSKEADLPGGTAAIALSNAKRRSTMNSRAAVDEEEAFLKAIEESKSDGTTGNGTRKGKRVRDESSEEMKQEMKRRKTGSDSDSPTLAHAESTVAPSDSEVRGPTSNGRRKGRGAVGSIQRERDTREREKEKERERVEAAGRRKGRAEKRRVEEAEAADEASRVSGSARVQTSAKQSRSQGPSKPSPNPAISTSSTAQRKGVRPGTSKRGRVGRNQYTKERDGLQDSKHGSPQAPNSRDSEEVLQSDGHGGGQQVNGTKPAKPRPMSNRTSMNDLRKRAAGILEYISRTQVEMAGEKTPPQQEESSPGTSRGVSKAGTTATNGASKLSHQVDVLPGQTSAEKPKDDLSGETVASETVEGGEEGVARVDETTFKKLSSLQMMDVLTRELVHWQKDYGKWGEK